MSDPGNVLKRDDSHDSQTQVIVVMSTLNTNAVTGMLAERERAPSACF